MEIFLHEVLAKVVNLAIAVFELMGVGVIIIAGIAGIISYIRRDPLTRLKLAKGMAMGLEFKLGSEILRTVVVREDVYKRQSSSGVAACAAVSPDKLKYMKKEENHAG